MKRILAIAFLFFSCGCLASQALAQGLNPKRERLTLTEAVERALQNHPKMTIQEKAIERVQGLKTTVSVPPNPTLSYYREDLAHNNVDIGEWILSGSLPLNFLWTRWSQISAANQQVESERLLLADVRRQIAFEVQKAYVETHFAEKNLDAWQKATAVLERAAKAGQARFTDGDLSGYDQQRIALEQMRYRKAETEARIQLNSDQRRLAFLIAPDQAGIIIETTDTYQVPTPDIVETDLLETALQNRPDLQAAQAVLRSKQSYLTANKWQALPEITAMAGYKKQLDDFKGSVLQLNIGIPIFDRNQGRIKSARAEVEQQSLTSDLLERQIAMEVRLAYESYQLYRRQVENLFEESYQAPDEFLQTALFAYDEGELSLLELLDGVRAFSESFQTKNNLLLQYQLSVFELEKATAIHFEDF